MAGCIVLDISEGDADKNAQSRFQASIRLR